MGFFLKNIEVSNMSKEKKTNPVEREKVNLETIKPVAIRSIDMAFARINEINYRVEELAEEIKSSQKEYVGAVTLNLYDCGKDCLGCPHPKWRFWFARKVHPKSTETILLSTQVKYPLKRLLKKGPHAENYEATRLLVKEAVDLFKERTEILQTISNMNRKFYHLGKG